MDGGKYIGPEMVRLLQEFECTLPSCDKQTCLEHHEEGLSHQKAFQKHVCENCPELVIMDTRDRVDDSVVAMVRTIKERGRAQYEKILHQRAD